MWGPPPLHLRAGTPQPFRGDILRSQTILELPMVDILAYIEEAKRRGISLDAGTYLRVLIFNDYDSDGHNVLSYDYRLGRIYPLG